MYIFFVLCNENRKIRLVNNFKKFVSRKIKIIQFDDLLFEEFLNSLKICKSSYIYKLHREYIFGNYYNSFICLTKKSEDIFSENIVYLKLKYDFKIEEVSSEYKQLIVDYIDIQKMYRKYSKTLDKLYVGFVNFCLYGDRGIEKSEFEKNTQIIENLLKTFSDKYDNKYCKDFVYRLIQETFRKYGSNRRTILRVDYKLK